VSKEEIEKFIHTVYASLMRYDIEKTLINCTKDVNLTFASYVFKNGEEIDESHAFNELEASYEFKGIDEIKELILWVRNQFSNLKYKHRQIFVKKNKTFHTFMIEFTIPNGKGVLPVHALYEFDAWTFQRIQIRFLPGYLILKRKNQHIIGHEHGV